eukprot:TRINITY_DN13485_c0_g1_i1.p2 TRINITY_DN13485_c0_g1~~TRINITY_DN13485_c0_g1_i1.p2  ORF type:complete len:113 (+),score=37.90 TRINITY_DN13485_c0_g1_i1:86-424(+)
MVQEAQLLRALGSCVEQGGGRVRSCAAVDGSGLVIGQHTRPDVPRDEAPELGQLALLSGMAQQLAGQGEHAPAVSVETDRRVVHVQRYGGCVVVVCEDLAAAAAPTSSAASQ